MVYTRNTIKIKTMNFDKEIHDDDSDDSDYVPSSEYSEDDEECSEDENDEDEDEDFDINEIQMDKKKNVLLSEEFKALLKKIDELDPDIYKYITSNYIKEKDKIKLCELYTILVSQEPFSIEWIEIRNLIKNELKRINRKVCFFKDVDQNILNKKLEEFKLVKKQIDLPLKEQIILLDAPVVTKSYIYSKYKELSEYSTGDTEYAKICTWLQCALQVPYTITKPINVASESMSTFLNSVYDKLNNEFYGLQKVKEQILLFLNMRLTNPNSKGYNLALLGSKGVGKCFAKDTLILMSDNKLKRVQDITINDNVMGIDGKPRNVVHLIKGFDKMYTIHQEFSEPYTVSTGHVLVLKCIKEVSWIDKIIYKLNVHTNDILKIIVDKFYKLPKRVQNCFVGIQTKIEIENSNNNLPIDPYLLGLCMGNGETNPIEFTVYNDSVDLKNKLEYFANIYSTELNPVLIQGNFTTFKFKTDEILIKKLKILGVWQKFTGIPCSYKNASFANRNKFIAGFLDSNGVYNFKNNTFTCYLNGTIPYIYDFIKLARSVGLYSKIAVNREMVIITGDFSKLPIMCHTINTDIIQLNTIKIEEKIGSFFYGFEVTDDHMFLLHDYTIVHNCFAKDTSLLLYNGDKKMIQDIKPDDELMGDDGYKRIVSETTNGSEQMYKIIPDKYGNSYTVNESHILSLYDVVEKKYIDISVKDVLNLPSYSHLHGYKRCRFRNEHVNKTLLYLSACHGISYALHTLNLERVYIPERYLYMIDDDVLENVYGNIFKSKLYTNYIDFIKTKEELIYYCIGIVITCLDFIENSSFVYPLKFKNIFQMYNFFDNNIFRFLHIFELLNVNLYSFFSCNTIENLLHTLMYSSDCELLNYGFFYEIKIEKSMFDTYYGFTLAPNSINRRFLLDDGTVVHNTHISRTLANILDFPFEQISIGNVTNAEILTGHQFTYVGSKPGSILNSLINMKYKNGIIFLDEFDKVQNIDVSNTLLHIVDGTQNHEFTDNYLGQQIKIDLSNIWFIFSMNAVPESGPLKDRLFVIEIDGYTTNEKCKITKDYLLPRVCKNVGLNSDDIVLTEDMAIYLVNKFSQDEQDNKGVRYIEKKLYDFVNKIVFLVNTESTFKQLSFSMSKKLSYPVHITHELIDNLMTCKSSASTSYTMMYC